MYISPKESRAISTLIRDAQFRLDVANLLKPADKQYKLGDDEHIALSQSRLYGVIASAKTLVAFDHACDLDAALRMLIVGGSSAVVSFSNDIVHWTWAAVEPVKGVERLSRDAFRDTDELPPDEVEKDRVRIVATAQLLLKRMHALGAFDTQ